MKLFYALAATSFVFGAISAQATQDIDSLQLQGRFLSGELKQIGGSTLIITADEIAKAPAQSIEEVLAYHTGIDIRKRGANGVQTDLSIRGSSFEQVLLLVNGLKMTDSQTGHNTMNLPFDPSAVKRIEVIKGPAARRFGQNAYGGVINIITYENEERGSTIRLSSGDFTTAEVGATTNFKALKANTMVSASHSQSQGYRHNTDYKISNIWVQQRYDLKNSTLKFMSGFQQKDFGANGFYATPAATEQYEEVQVALTGITWEKLAGNWVWNSDFSWRRAQDMYLYIRNKPEVYRNMHIGNSIEANFNASYSSKLGTTGLGAGVRQEFLASSNLGNRERFITQLFAEHHLRLGQLSLTPGLSWSAYSNGENYFFPGLDARFKMNTASSLFGSVAKVHRIPTYTDLFYTSRTEQGYALLKPETAVSAELGYRYFTQKAFFELSFFGRNTNDAIDWVKGQASDKWEAQNIGEISTAGLEARLSQHFNGFLESYEVGYTYLNSEFTQQETFSRYALDNLRHQFTANLNTRILPSLTTALSYRFLDRVTLPSYHLLDSKINKRQGQTNIYVLINNITNTKYTETSLVPMPGRWFHIGIELNFDK